LPLHGAAFDRDVWVETRNNRGARHPRDPMVNAVRVRLYRDKPARQEVIALLGEPGMSERDKRGRDFLSYGLGTLYSLDYHSLDIYFDENDRVTKMCIVQH
jgi:hypothetical protein